MRFCFIVEEQYRHEVMPVAIADLLLRQGHGVDLLAPEETLTCLSDLAQQNYDAYILKTIAGGPGLSILAAAEAVGKLTINNSHSIHHVRDKAVAATIAYKHGLPIPHTYFVAHQRLLEQIPEAEYPIVVKPTNGNSCRGIYLLESPSELLALQMVAGDARFFLAQRYVENSGFDIKLYVTGPEVYAVARKSPLHANIKEGPLHITPSLRKLALSVGKLFGLDIYGLDVVETARGPMVLDINDFPSFGLVPKAVEHVSEYILDVTGRIQTKRADFVSFKRRHEALIKGRSRLVQGEIVHIANLKSAI